MVVPAMGQDRLPTMPRYDRYQKLSREIGSSVVRGEVVPRWADDGGRLGYSFQGKNYIVDLKTGVRTEGTLPAPPRTTPPQSDRRPRPERGRQFTEVFSSDGKLKAFYRDRNVWLSDTDGASNERAITTEGSVEKRTKYGQASWVYGEELGVREAMWFSPDGKYLAYYGFDESKVKDYYLTLNHGGIQTELDVEAYPKAGTDNPVVGLYVFDISAQKVQQIDTDFGDAEVGHYVYDVRWAPAGGQLLFNRTNRKQNILQFCAANPADGKCRVVVEERRPQSWTENSPRITWLKDNQSFIWRSDRTDFNNLYLGHLDGRPLKALTSHKFEVVGVTRVDEDQKKIWYTARSGENPYLVQLHRMNLDGTGDVRLTDPKFHNTVNLSPKGDYFTTVEERIDIPPKTVLRDGSGKAISTLAESDLTKFDQLGLKRSERFVAKAADGVTDIYGTLNFPSDFDPAKKYPLIVSVYAGPESGSSGERFDTPDAVTEFGFLVASIDGRGTQSRGKVFLESVYGKLGVVEIDDQAAGVKYLATRPYVDGKRVGIHGTSYGGYASALALLRHPDVFQVAVASASVTDWRHYDTIYTERYMGLPWENENKKGYDEGSAMTYLRNLKGRLMLYYGTADNNVHPSNTLQLTQALQRAGKSFDMLVGTDVGHAGIPFARLWEYFIEHLVLTDPKRDPLLAAYREMKARRSGPG
jgi:dipeptidyl-peptidase-4